MPTADTLVFYFLMMSMVILGAMAIWGNWIWDGQSKPPSFFRFWFVLAPRAFLKCFVGR